MVVSARTEVGVLSEAALEFEAAAALARQAAGRLLQVAKLAELKNDPAVIATWRAMVDDCQAAQKSATAFAQQCRDYVAPCDVIVRSWAEQERRAQPSTGGKAAVTWESPKAPAAPPPRELAS